MLARVVAFALTQRGFLGIGVVVLLVVGWNAFLQTPIDAFPDVSSPQVKVILRAPGMTPEEVESRITAPVEVEMLGIPRQRVLRSVTRYALTDVTIDFEEGTDIYWARQQVAERLANLRDLLPPGLEGGVAPLTTPLGEMFMFTIESDDMDLRERRALLDWTIRPALRTVRGVADVNALGGEVATFEVVPRAESLLAHGLSLHEVQSALVRNNRDDGSGRLVSGEEILLVRTRGAVRTLDDLAAIVVGGSAAEPVRLGDVAHVRIGALTRYGSVSRDGVGETVQGLVLGLPGANAREVVEGVRARLAEIAPGLPEGVHIDVFYDRGELIDRAVWTVQGAVYGAVVLVLLVLIVFLADWRAAATTALVLPVAVLATFIWMRVFGLSANLMSLGGLAIAVGMLVDSAVVVVENITARLADAAAARQPKRYVVFRATREVARPVVSGTLIIVLVFLPLLTLEGFEAKLFVPVALAIVFALASALAVSLTVLPVVASLLVRAGSASPRWIRAVEAFYRSRLEVALRHPLPVVAGTLVLLVAAAVAYLGVGRAFLPEMDEGTVVVQLEKLPSIRLGTSTELDVRWQRALIDRVPEVLGVVARTGADEIGLDPMGFHETDAFLRLLPRDRWEVRTKDELLDRIRAVMHDFPGMAYAFTQPIDMRVSEMLTGVRGDVAVKVFGHDLHALEETAARIAGVIRGVRGAEDVFRTRTEGAEYLHLDIDRLQVGRLGLDIVSLQEMLRALVEGVRVGTVFDGPRRLPLVVRGEPELRQAPIDFSRHWVALGGGEAVPLDRLAQIRQAEGPVEIRRESAARLATVTVNVRGRDLVGFVEEARARVEAERLLPEGFRLEWGGQFENQQRAARRLALVVPVALGLILVILVSTFGSIGHAFLVLGNVPLALIGGVFSLWISGAYLSVPATIGFIALLGIAVLNGVVLVSTFNDLRAQGMPLDEVVREGAVRRLRPVLMTAASTALGLLPLLLATGPGSELQKPLATVVIGGLTTSTALTLVLLPLSYRWLARFERRRRGGVHA